jgi:hypothetical protein
LLEVVGGVVALQNGVANCQRIAILQYVLECRRVSQGARFYFQHFINLHEIYSVWAPALYRTKIMQTRLMMAAAAAG